MNGLTLTTNAELANPTNAKAGQAGSIYITQDATGGRTLIFGTNWQFAGGTAPVLSTAPGAVDILNYKARSPTVIVGQLLKGVQA
ncbi:MAG: hypothetical protein WDN46_07750 [Methylocella sp.]